MDDQLRAVVPFLSLSHRPQVRLQALNIVEGFTAVDGLDVALTKAGAVPFLVRMLGDAAFNSSALNALVNLFAAVSDARIAALEVNVVERLLDLVRSDGEVAELVIMALVNLTQEEGASLVLLQGEMNGKGRYLPRLLQHWSSALVPDVFVNVAQLSSGRSALNSLDLLDNVAHDLSNAPIDRRRSVLRLVRNLAFDVAAHDHLLHERIVVALLLPLVGPEPMKSSDLTDMLGALALSNLPDKRREADRETRLLIIQVLGVFLRVQSSRAFFRRIKLYPILRDLHLSEDEDDVEITSAIEDLIPFLVNDEDGAVPPQPNH